MNVMLLIVSCIALRVDPSQQNAFPSWCSLRRECAGGRKLLPLEGCAIMAYCKTPFGNLSRNSKIVSALLIDENRRPVRLTLIILIRKISLAQPLNNITRL
jgi:hypothetical protein